MNNNPSITPQVVVSPFKNFCMSIGSIPTSYQDSLDYYETLLWLIKFLDETVIPAVATNGNAVAELQNFYLQLQTYVNDYFENLDVQEEINNKLDNMALDGSLTALIKDYVDPIYQVYENSINNAVSNQNFRITNVEHELSNIASGSPKGSYATVADLKSANPVTGVYIVTGNGHIYSWTENQSGDPIDLGVYQATSIADGSVTLDKLGDDVQYDLDVKINKKDKLYNDKKVNISLEDNLVNKAVNTSTGELTIDNNTRVATVTLIYLPPNANIEFDLGSLKGNVYYFDDKKEFIKMQELNSDKILTYKAPNASYIRFLFTKYPTTQEITPSDVLSNISIYFKVENKNIEYTSSNNMVDLTKSKNGYLGSNGMLIQQGTYKTTDFIPIKANENYIISRFRFLALFDKNYNLIPNSYIDTDTSNHIVNNSTDCYVVFTYSTNYESTVQMNKGTTLLPYEDYKKVLPSDIYINEAQVYGFQESLDNIKNSNILYGKKYVACGDSFTQGDFTNSPTQDYTFTDGLYSGQNKVYPFFIGRRNNMTIVNEAISGSTMTTIDGSSHTDSFSRENGRYTQIPADADYITLKFGINDDSTHQNAPIGTINDTTNNTFYGAYNVVMDYIIRNHPNAKIGIIVTNGANAAIVEATKNIAKKWGVPYLDEATGEQVPLLIRTIKTNVDSSIKRFRDLQWEVNPTSGSGNNGHPNAKCHEYESTIVENFLRSL